MQKSDPLSIAAVQGRASRAEGDFCITLLVSNPTREFPLFVRLGAEDLPGAVRAVPTDAGGAALEPDDQSSEEAHGEDEPILKFSLAGAQPKLSVRADDRGVTLPLRGTAGNAILKTPDPRPGFTGVPRAEFAALELARAVGLDVPATRLVDAHDIVGLGRWADMGPGPSFLIARYDRLPGDRRVHAEELAQVLDIPTGDRPKYRYTNFETVANLYAALVGVEAVGTVVDRIVLNVLVGNGDAHLKNWSIVYPDGRRPAMSPLYDVVPTVLYIPGDGLGPKLDNSRDFRHVRPESFRRLGERSGFGGGPAVQRAVEAVERVMVHWNLLRDLLPAEQHRRLERRLEELALTGRPGE